jgi:hypothetical protein
MGKRKAIKTEGRKQKQEAWRLDQLVKSRIFHRMLHEWGLIDLAAEIEELKGENYDWSDRKDLGIKEQAWNKVIHRGIKPVKVFAHPKVLQENPRRVAYYRMLAMVSQKSMSNVGLPIAAWEKGSRTKKIDDTQAHHLARHLNEFVSELICEDPEVNERELDLWRGMTAGAQAQGTWQNIKGKKAEKQVYDLITSALDRLGATKGKGRQFRLPDGRLVIFGKDPDVEVCLNAKILAAVEIKGGIDPAGALERLGAALKTLERIQREHPEAALILVASSAAMTTAFRFELEKRSHIHFFALEDLLTSEKEAQEFLSVMGIAFHLDA